MKAMTLAAHGGRDALVLRSDIEAPRPGQGQVRVSVKATGVNHVDGVLRRGYPGLQLSLPHILGGDVAGIIDEVGEGVDRARIGERVVVYPVSSCGTCLPCRRGNALTCMRWQFLGMQRAGGYAEFCVVDDENALPLPARVSFEAAAALPVSGLTALHALNVGELKEGETFFVWGGGSGTGLLAVALARRRGARVIATCSTDERREQLLAAGCDLVLRRGSDDVAACVAERFPDGVDVVFEHVGPATFSTSVALLGKNGRVVVCGMITGREVTLNVQQLYLKHGSVRGLYLGTRDELASLVAMTDRGELAPTIGAVLPLSEAPAAHALLEESRVAGKIVLVP